jgi:hypothetical protein
MEPDFFSEFFEETSEGNYAILTEDERNNELESEISPPVRANLDNLLMNGRISETFSFAGHEFVMRTLTIGEELAITDICGPYEGTLGQARALATATVAAALESVDGMPLMQSIGPDPNSSVRQKFNFIKNKWYWNVVGHLYQQYIVLVEKQLVAFEALQGK